LGHLTSLLWEGVASDIPYRRRCECGATEPYHGDHKSSQTETDLRAISPSCSGRESPDNPSQVEARWSATHHETSPRQMRIMDSTTRNELQHIEAAARNQHQNITTSRQQHEGWTRAKCLGLALGTAESTLVLRIIRRSRQRHEHCESASEHHNITTTTRRLDEG
jgi:hypothetical protein